MNSDKRAVIGCGLVLVILIAVGVIGSILSGQSEPVPPAGKYGYYAGQDPRVSFHYTEDGVEDFKIVTNACKFSVEQGAWLRVDSDGEIDFENGRLGPKVKGRIHDTTASGTYFWSCGGASGIQQGTWTAEYVRP